MVQSTQTQVRYLALVGESNDLEEEEEEVHSWIGNSDWCMHSHCMVIDFRSAAFCQMSEDS